MNALQCLLKKNVTEPTGLELNFISSAALIVHQFIIICCLMMMAPVSYVNV